MERCAVAAAPKHIARPAPARIATTEIVANWILLPYLARLTHPPRLAIDAAPAERDLLDGEVTLAVRFRRPVKGPYRISKLGTIRMALYAARNADAEGLGFIGWTGAFENIGLSRWLRASFGDAPPTLALTTIEAHRAAALAGLGIAGLPLFVADRGWTNGREISFIDLDYATLPRTIADHSPTGELPVLKLDGVVHTAKTVAIAEYLDNVTGLGLLPDNALVRLKVREREQRAGALLDTMRLTFRRDAQWGLHQGLFYRLGRRLGRPVGRGLPVEREDRVARREQDLVGLRIAGEDARQDDRADHRRPRAHREVPRARRIVRG